MTRKLPAIFFALLLLVLIPQVNAQTATTGSAQTTASAASKLRDQMQLLQEQKKTAVNQLKDEAKAAIQAKREEFRARIQTIKDQRKKTLVARIDVKLAEANKRLTLKFSEALTRIQGFLDKIKQLTTDTGVLAKITAAQSVIDAAKTAVDEQQAKTYTMEIVDDTTLKVNAGMTVSQLRQDLVAVYKLVIDAKQAVQKLNTEKSVIKKEATSSANL